MEHAYAYLLFFMFMCLTISYAKEYLQNPDFKIPPTNLTSNTSLLQPGTNSIPGWSFNGTIWYLPSGALQLGRNGEINQTIRDVDDDVGDFILSFTLAAQTQACIDNVSVNVSVYKRSEFESETQFFLQRNYSTNLWGRRALYLEQYLGGGQNVDIHITSVENNNSSIMTNCWPVVDAFLVSKIKVYGTKPSNLLNGDFELGSTLLKNLSEGIILNGKERMDQYESPLQRWSILGTIKYIGYNGNAAIELLSGSQSGIRKEFLDPPRTPTLSFTIGDANDSCLADFTVYVRAGADEFNFTFRSLGTGSAVNHSVKLSSALNVLTFFSLNETKTSDGVLCGPVLDNILVISYGERKHVYVSFVFLSWFFALLCFGAPLLISSM